MLHVTMIMHHKIAYCVSFALGTPPAPSPPLLPQFKPHKLTPALVLCQVSHWYHQFIAVHHRACFLFLEAERPSLPCLESGTTSRTGPVTVRWTALYDIRNISI